MYCFNCAREVDGQWKFCRFCGQRMAVDCFVCGARCPVDSLFCHECGVRMSESHVSSDPTRGQPHYGRPTGLLCSRCRTANEPGSAYCYSCGLPLDDRTLSHQGPAPYAVPVSGRVYLSLRVRSNWTVGLLVAICIASALSIFTAIDLMQIERQAEAGQYTLYDAPGYAASRLENMGMLVFLMQFPTALAVLMWVHRASNNLEPLGAHVQRFSPAWSVGWWFVPIMNLFRPYQVLAEIWKGSVCGQTLPGPNWHNRRVSPMLAWWWWMWIVARITSYVLYFLPDSAGGISGFLLFWVLTDLLSMCAGVLAIRIVRRVKRGQEELHQELMAG